MVFIAAVCLVLIVTLVVIWFGFIFAVFWNDRELGWGLFSFACGVVFRLLVD